jgi:23S rRNA (guanosine2251-2'-O)-methyltransferase
LPANAHLIYGIHAVKAALENPKRTCHTLLMSDSGAIKLGFGDGKLPSFGKIVAPKELDMACPEDAVHQGAVLIAAPLNAPNLEQLEGAQLVLVLDQVTDPHNVGAILRSASALKADALVMTERHSAPLDGVTAKTASGGVEHTPVCFVSNLATAITDLRDLGFFTVGLDSEGESDLAALPLSAPLALVLGAEGKGLRRLTRERCDALARIDMPGAIKSLNVSNAALLSLYIARSKLG